MTNAELVIIPLPDRHRRIQHNRGQAVVRHRGVLQIHQGGREIPPRRQDRPQPQRAVRIEGYERLVQRQPGEVLRRVPGHPQLHLDGVLPQGQPPGHLGERTGEAGLDLSDVPDNGFGARHALPTPQPHPISRCSEVIELPGGQSLRAENRRFRTELLEDTLE